MMQSKGKSNATAQPRLSAVTLALQLASGERLVNEFPPQVSLWDVLQHWDKEGRLEPSLTSLSSEIPTCVYLRKEIAAQESLQSTTLLDLGITSGKVAIRFITKSDELKEQPHVGGVLARPPPKPEPTVVPPPKPEATTTTPESTSFPVQESLKPEINPSDSIHPEPVEMPVKDVEMEKVGMAVKDVEMEKPSQVEEVVVHEPSIDIESSKPPEHLTEAEGVGPVQYLNNRDGHVLYLRSADEPLPIKSHYSSEEDDDFFEHTEDDIHAMMRGLIRESQKLQNAPFVTAQTRQAQEEERQMRLIQRYPTTVLRVQFVDGFILQMPVPSETHLQEVKKELLQYLDGPPMDLDDFILYTAPPKEILRTDAPLHKLGLTPSSLIYIGPSNPPEKGGRIPAVKIECKQFVSSFSAATRDVVHRLKQSPMDTGNVSDSSKGSAGLPTSSKRSAVSSSASSTASGSASATGIVPKWLKLKR